MTKYIISYHWKKLTAERRDFGEFEHAVKAKNLLAALRKSEKLFAKKFPDRQIMCLSRQTQIEDDDGTRW